MHFVFKRKLYDFGKGFISFIIYQTDFVLLVLKFKLLFLSDGQNEIITTIILWC